MKPATTHTPDTRSPITGHTDATTTLAQTKEWTNAFLVERDWWQFHTLKDDVVAMASEVGELADLVRYKTDEQLRRKLANDPKLAEQFRDEVADVLWEVLLLAQNAKIDLASALADKIRKTALKYPAEKVKGIERKYSDY